MAKTYRSNGSAAYDVYAARKNTAQPLPKPQRLPDAPSKSRPKPQTKARPAIAPFTLLGTVAVAALLLVALFSYIRLYEVQSESAEMQSQLDTLIEEQAFLQSKYEQSIDMQYVEQRAKELGLRRPTASQTVQVNIRGENAAESFAVSEENVFEEIFGALKRAFSEALEYFS